MKLKIKLLRHSAQVPTYATAKASGMDCRACLDPYEQALEPGRSLRVPLGFAVELPTGHELQMRPRSGLAFVHTVLGYWGTIDEDYRGEVCALLTNLGQETIHLCHGDRVCQAVLAPVVRADVIEVVDELSPTERGGKGFGSTGMR